MIYKRLTILYIFVYGFLFQAGAFELYKDSTKLKGRFSSGINFTSTETGLTFTKSLTNRLDIRLQGSYFGYTYDISNVSEELQGDAILRTGSAGGFIDFYLLKFFYLSAGVSYNFTNVKIFGKLNEAIEIGDILLEPDEIGQLNLKIEPGLKVNPYLGIGFNTSRKRNFNFGLDIGLFYQDSPDVTIKATGMLEPTGNPEQEHRMEQNIAPVIYYPYVSFRFSFLIKNSKQ